MLNDPDALAECNEFFGGRESPPPLPSALIQSSQQQTGLDIILREQLHADGVRLTAHPYSTPVSFLPNIYNYSWNSFVCCYLYFLFLCSHLFLFYSCILNLIRHFPCLSVKIILLFFFK